MQALWWSRKEKLQNAKKACDDIVVTKLMSEFESESIIPNYYKISGNQLFSVVCFIFLLSSLPLIMRLRLHPIFAHWILKDLVTIFTHNGNMAGSEG